jgi:hypothetical protein
MGVKCFFLEAIESQRRWLRRFVFSSTAKCVGPLNYHNAMVLLDDAPLQLNAHGRIEEERWPADDPRWPKKCEHCEYEFRGLDQRQLFVRRLYWRQDTGAVMTTEEAPPGAMWYADWMIHEATNWNRGPDGHCLVVKCPDGHDWTVDSRASNCTQPNDNAHKCWVRHGTPPLITVDKNGLTCDAGAGSIQTPKWHVFLRNGELVT